MCLALQLLFYFQSLTSWYKMTAIFLTGCLKEEEWMLDREKRDHHESTPRRLPIQTPGQGTYGKQQSELDLAWALATPA